MGPVLGGVGIGLVWGSLLVMVAWPVRSHSIVTALGLGLASIAMVAGVFALTGFEAAAALVVAAGVAVMLGVSARAELQRARDSRG